MKTSTSNATVTDDAVIIDMKERVCEANVMLKRAGLVVLTWGNVSEINRELGVIVETFTKQQRDPTAVPGVLVRSHGPFTWGRTPKEAVENSIILEEVANMALGTEIISNHHKHLSAYILDKHYFRKHGENAYYGQNAKA